MDALHDLADTCHPPSESLGPGVFGVSFGRMDDARSMVFEPPEVVLDTLETFVGYVGSPKHSEPTLMSLVLG